MGMVNQQISDDLKVALKAGDELKKSVLRMLMSAFKNKEIALSKKDSGLSEDETLQVLRTEVKRRWEAAEQFEKGGRGDLAKKEQEEARVLETYLPREISEEELLGVVKSALKEVVAQSSKDFGVAMKAAMAKLHGAVGGERVAQMVKKILSEKESQ